MRKRADDTLGGSKKNARRASGGKKRSVFVIVILIGVVIFFLSTTFSKASVSLTLASGEVAIDGVFTAVREPAQVPDGISYSRRGPYDETKEAMVTDITREPRNTHAKGTVTVYNPHTEQLQLINRTRFQTEDGRIYRLKGQQTVPPATKGDDGALVPGEKEVEIEGGAIGSSYNLNEKNVRLTIPGLADVPNFKNAYALSKDRIVGGFDGERFIPNKEEEAKKREQLRRDIEKNLRDTLMQSLDNNSLKDRVVFEDGIFIIYESLENEQRDDSVVLREKGTLYAISFRESDLAALLSKYAPTSAPRNVAPVNVNEAGMAMELEKKEEFDIVSSTEFRFRLSGSARLFWGIDPLLFLSDVVGKDRAEVEEIILGQYPQVTRINDISIFPVWRASLPGNRSKIQVDVAHDTPEGRG